jgi:hypothetical protein
MSNFWPAFNLHCLQIGAFQKQEFMRVSARDILPRKAFK